MFSHSARKLFLCLLTGTVLVFCLEASPAHAKKQAAADTADRGGLFQPPTAISKPNLLPDTSVSKVNGRTGDALRQNSPEAASAAPAVSVSPTVPVPPAATNGIVPVRAFEPTRSIESMRLHSLFE